MAMRGRKKMENLVEHYHAVMDVERKLESLAYSHEGVTPLTAYMCYARDLLKKEGVDPELRELVEEMESLFDEMQPKIQAFHCRALKLKDSYLQEATREGVDFRNQFGNW